MTNSLKGVGKTSVLTRYTKDEFATEYNVTVGAEFGSKMINIDGGGKAKLQIWDTAGQESFLSIIKSFYRGAHAIFVTYNVNRKESFENLRLWMNDLSEYADENAILVLVGNQIDKPDQREVPYEEGETFMKDNNMHFFFETSAFSGLNVDLAFRETAKVAYAQMMKDRAENKEGPRRETVTLRPGAKKQDAAGGCNC